MFFDDWPTLARTLATAPLAYAALLLVVRISGKRALGKLNAFDMVVTVSLGSVLASAAVSPNVTLTSAAAAFAVLVGLQYLIATLSSRSRVFQGMVKARPTLLLRDGELCDDTMRRQRVSRSELLQVLRQQGIAAFDEVAAVVLETDGTFSVLRHAPAAPRSSTLANVHGWT